VAVSHLQFFFGRPPVCFSLRCSCDLDLFKELSTLCCNALCIMGVVFIVQRVDLH
jgi:hypothetical protein